MPPIRRATASDAPACAQIVGAWLGATPLITHPPSIADLESGLAAGIPAYQVWVIGDPVAGYLSFCPNEALIRGFYTGVQGRGLGKALLDHIKSGNSYLQLWTHAPNTRAHGFYQREGFTFTGARRAGNDGLDELQMEWGTRTP